MLVTGYKCQRRCKRHLETGMDYGFRREEKHTNGRNRNGAERERLAIDQHADEHNGDHDERPLGRNFRP